MASRNFCRRSVGTPKQKPNSSPNTDRKHNPTVVSHEKKPVYHGQGHPKTGLIVDTYMMKNE